VLYSLSRVRVETFYALGALLRPVFVAKLLRVLGGSERPRVVIVVRGIGEQAHGVCPNLLLKPLILLAFVSLIARDYVSQALGEVQQDSLSNPLMDAPEVRRHFRHRCDWMIV
jgi:hypothetical protein